MVEGRAQQRQVQGWDAGMARAGKALVVQTALRKDAEVGTQHC